MVDPLAISLSDVVSSPPPPRFFFLRHRFILVHTHSPRFGGGEASLDLSPCIAFFAIDLPDAVYFLPIRVTHLPIALIYPTKLRRPNGPSSMEDDGPNDSRFLMNSQPTPLYQQKIASPPLVSDQEKRIGDGPGWKTKPGFDDTRQVDLVSGPQEAGPRSQIRRLLIRRRTWRQTTDLPVS